MQRLRGDMMGYRLLEETSRVDLIVAVEAAIVSGWAPLGGVAVVCRSTYKDRNGYEAHDWTWVQAMTKGERSE